MKKTVLFLALPFVFIATLTAQITQKQADEIVINHISGDTKPHTIFAKEVVQADGFTVITSKSEMLELDYSCFVYYVKYDEETNGKYLIVKESNGNLLEVNTKNDEGPDDLEEWRVVIHYPIELSFENYSLEGSSCHWTNLPYNDKVIIINNSVELEKYISCNEGSYPAIDFSKHSLILASGKTDIGIYEIVANNLLQLSSNKFKLTVGIVLYGIVNIESWNIALLVEKLNKESVLELNVAFEGVEFCQTWVLIEKEINNTTEVMPPDDIYPVTLTFYPTKEFRGRHDANIYEGTFWISRDAISFSYTGITDVTDIDWYLIYLLELSEISKVFISSHNSDTNNMQLQLSNSDGSIRLNLINKKWFEETYFELEDWYNF